MQNIDRISHEQSEASRWLHLVALRAVFFDLNDRIKVFTFNEIMVTPRCPRKAGGGSIPSLATNSIPRFSTGTPTLPDTR